MAHKPHAPNRPAGIVSGIRNLPLEIELDVDRHGNYFAAIYTLLGDRQKILDIAAVSRYGYTIKLKGITYMPALQDLETLCALQTILGTPDSEGRLPCDMTIPMLSFLRSRDNVKETDTAKSMKISDEPLVPIIKIDYRPQTGIVIQTGYQIPGTETILPAPSIKSPDNTGHIKSSAGFFPAPDEPAGGLKALLDKPALSVALAGVPQFFTIDMKAIPKEAAVILNDDAKKISVENTPWAVHVAADVIAEETIEICWECTAGNHTIPFVMLQEVSDYLHIDDYTWIRRDQQAVRKIFESCSAAGVDCKDTKIQMPLVSFFEFSKKALQSGIALRRTAALDELVRKKTLAHKIETPQPQGPSILSSVLKTTLSEQKPPAAPPAPPAPTAKQAEKPAENPAQPPDEKLAEKPAEKPAVKPPENETPKTSA